MTASDVLVIGAGLAGASAAWRLSELGHTVTVLERTTPANDEGSSHGSARIFRYAYPSKLYTDLVVRARSGWDELESRSGRALITPTGAVDFGELRDPAGLARVLDASGVDHELLTRADARSRFPQIAFDSDVLYQPGAGVIDAEAAVAAMLALAEATGRADVRTGWDLTGLTRLGPSRLEARSATGETVTGNKVVVAAGGWLPHLLGRLDLDPGFVASFPPLEVRQEQVFHLPWRPVDSRGVAYPAWPTFIHATEEILTYGLPGGRDGGFRGQKLAEFNGGRVLSSALDQDGVIQPEMRSKIVAYAERYFPGLLPEPYGETTCLFTNTPTEDFVIDEQDGIVVLSACSGHGAKFAPLLGELAADLVTGSRSGVEEFRIASRARTGRD